jgi:hypothetical protein
VKHKDRATFAIAGVGAMLAAFVVVNLFSQQFYVQQSRSVPTSAVSSFLEVAQASYLHLASRLMRLQTLPPNIKFVVSDTYNFVLGKLESDYTRPRELIFPSDDYLRVGAYLPERSALLMALHSKHLEDFALRASRERLSLQVAEHFPIIGKDGRRLDNGFYRDSRFDSIVPAETVYLRTSPALSPLNRWDGSGLEPISVQPFADVHDQLVFIASALGQPYYEHNIHSSIFQLEPDYFIRGSTMAAIGRYLLFEVIHPGKSVRLEIWLSDSLSSDGKNMLPPAAVIGKTRVPLGLEGSGSARVVSPAIEPLVVGGHAYVCIDMGVDGRALPSHRRGLQGLYGRDVVIDPRLVVAFVRDISALDVRTFGSLDIPRVFRGSKEAFQDRSFMYSGLYEDGWASVRSFVRLRSEPSERRVVVRGVIPLVANRSFRTKLTVYVDGEKVAAQDIGLGEFEVTGELPTHAGNHKVDMVYSARQSLPGEDGRPVGGILKYVGFE